MPNYVVTFSPNHEKWGLDEIMSVCQYYINFLKAKHQCDAWRVTTGYGDASKHPHFHAHLIKCDATARTIKRRFVGYLSETGVTMPHLEDTFFFRYERQGGTNTDVSAYLDKNADEYNIRLARFPGFKTTLIDTKSDDYEKVLDESRLADKVIPMPRYFNIVTTRLNNLIVKKKGSVGLSHQDITDTFDAIASEYFLHRINEFELTRLQNSLIAKYINRTTILS